MKNKKNIHFIHKTIVLLVSMLCSLMLVTSSFAGAIIIGNSGVPESEISKDDIEKIYTGKKSKWNDGSQVICVMLTSGDVHTDFLKTYLSKSPSQFKSLWKQMMFTGRGTPPKSFDTEAELIEYVSHTSGALGYVSSAPATVKQMLVSE